MQKSGIKVKLVREKDNSLKVKRKCRLVVRLKAIKYKKDISRYLSSYINFLGWFQLVPTFWPPTSIISDLRYCTGALWWCSSNVTSYQRPVGLHSYLKMFSTYGIILTIYFSKSEQSKM